MTLEAMRYAVARLLTDAAYRARFFAASPADPAAAAEHGLAPEEFRALAQLDPLKLTITTEGFSGKRFERVGSAFPRTLAALDAVEPGARAHYLGSTAFPLDEAAERATFLRFVRGPPPDGTATRAPDAQRLLEDLAALEALLYEAPPAGLPAYRFRPEATRPRRTALAALRLHLQGPLGAVLAASALPARYPAAPAEVLVLRDGGRVELEGLDGVAAGLLAACDGASTVAELARAHGPETGARLTRWLRRGVVEDAAPA